MSKPSSCPFCGSTSVETSDDALTNCGETYVFVECGDCRTQGPAITVGENVDEPCAATYEEGVEKAITAWNARAPNGTVVFMTDDYIGKLAARARRCTDLEQRIQATAEVPCVKTWGRRPMKCLPKDPCTFCRARTLLR